MEKISNNPEINDSEAGPASEHVVQPAQFTIFPEAGSNGHTGKSIDFLFDITLQVSVELGRTELSVRKILDLAVGSLVELNRLAGEPVDILVNGKPIARGEVVVVDDMFGVRIIDILSPHDRINTLK